MFDFLRFLSTEGGYSSINLSFNDTGLLGIAAYVFLSIGMYAIAKRRGISKPWLAWVPFGQLWILGCISDQYQYVVYGQTKSKRKLMLVLEILTSVFVIVILVSLLVFVFGIMAEMDWELLMQNPELSEDMIAGYLESNTEEMLGSLGLMFLMIIPAAVVSIWLTVVQYIAFHDLFVSCDPKNKNLYTALGVVTSVFGLSIILSVFVFVCRNRDGGMPPRAGEVSVAEPVYVPVEESVSGSAEIPNADVFSDQ